MRRRSPSMLPSRSIPKVPMRATTRVCCNFRDGWRNYEYRWGCGLTPHNQLKFPIPQWQGDSHPGEKLIVYGGEGLGDALQFCRYLPLLAKAGIDVTFFSRSKMLRLMRGLIPQV